MRGRAYKGKQKACWQFDSSSKCSPYGVCKAGAEGHCDGGPGGPPRPRLCVRRLLQHCALTAPIYAQTRLARSPHHVEEAEAELIGLMGHRNAADFRMMGLIREVEDQLGHYWGVKSMAHWLNWRCGIALGSARERVRVARALPSLPLISQAFECGSLSYSKVRAMTRVATPDTEPYFLNIARYGTASHLERAVRGYRQCTQVERVKRFERRELNYHFDDDGMLVLRARLTPEEGTLVLEALNECMEVLRDEAWHGEQGKAGDDTVAALSLQSESHQSGSDTRRDDVSAETHESTAGAPSTPSSSEDGTRDTEHAMCKQAARRSAVLRPNSPIRLHSPTTRLQMRQYLMLRWDHPAAMSSSR